MVTAVLLSGCLGVKTPPLSSSTPPSIFVDYQRTGGIAGLNDRVVIFDNGIILISSRGFSNESRLNQTELDRIDNLFEKNTFFSLNGNYTSQRRGADYFQYTISYRGKTVHTEDTAIPSSLEPIIFEMNGFLSQGTNNGQPGSPFSRLMPR
jgi:hypothetical protein